jgi:predicted nucleic acid-binding protein
VVVDASLWVSSLLPADAHHEAAARWLAENGGGDLAIPTLALVEVAGALARRATPELASRAVALLRAMPGLQIVSLDEPLAFEAARLASQQRLRGADAVYVTLAARLALPLVTLDEELAAREAAIVRIIQP